MENNEESPIKWSEKISLRIRKTIIVSRIFTIIMVIALIAAFIGLNVWLKTIDLPEIDVTSNKIYTLSDESKEALKSLDQDVKIYVYGLSEDESVIGLIKQYCDASDKLSYEMLSKESNAGKVQKFNLEDNNTCVILESGETNKVISTSEFQSMNYSTYEQIDVTEQVLTNSILNFTVANKPKVYIISGHDEFKEEVISELKKSLENEAFEVASLNLMTAGNVPEDCDILAILSPATDFLENETQEVIDYINKGGNIFVTRDALNQESQLTNFDRILAEYGVSVQNGYILERDSNYTIPSAPYIFMPHISEGSTITSDIATGNGMVLTFCEKLNFLSDEELEALKVSKEELLETSDSALFITDLTKNISEAATSAESGKFTIASSLTKTISEGTPTEDGDTEANDNSIKSKLIIVGNGAFLTDTIVSELTSQVSLINLADNKDFAINSIASLADKDEGLSIRKSVDSKVNVFTYTDNQNKVVLAIVFVVPVLVIVVGVIVGIGRKRRK